jgi:type I restriction enzyme S subunit
LRTETDELPEGWDAAPLIDLLSVLESGSRPKGGVRKIAIGIPSIGGEHLDAHGGFRFGKLKFVPVAFYRSMIRGHIHRGDVLVVKDGATTGKVSLVRGDFPYDPAVVNEHVFVCRPSREVPPEFLFRFLFSADGQERILEHFRGAAQGGITQEFASGTLVPVAPIAEQRRIVAKVEELLAEVNHVRERLARVPAILKRFRQSVLSAACSGRLTEDWRPCGGESEWAEVAVGDLDVTIQTGPFGTALHRHDYAAGGVPLVNPMHIRDGQIRPDREYAVSRKKAQELSCYRLLEGDVVLGRRGEMGRAAVVEGSQAGYLCGTGSLFIRPNREHLSPQFISIFFRSPEIVSELQETSVGSTMTNLNQGIIRALRFPKVDIVEQREIVRRVEKLFKLADETEQQVAAATKRVDKLTQAILAKAFRGERVPTEAELARKEGRSYEPASVLLERIRAERQAKSESPARSSVRRRRKL